MKFYTSGAEKMRLDTSGNLCLGNTSAAAKLDIRQDSGYAIRCENSSGHYFRVNSTGAVEVAGSEVITATRNLTNIGTYSGGGNLSTSGRITASGSRFQSTTTDNSHREYVITTGSGGGDFFLGQIEYNNCHRS